MGGEIPLPLSEAAWVVMKAGEALVQWWCCEAANTGISASAFGAGFPQAVGGEAWDTAKKLVSRCSSVLSAAGDRASVGIMHVHLISA